MFAGAELACYRGAKRQEVVVSVDERLEQRLGRLQPHGTTVQQRRRRRQCQSVAPTPKVGLDMDTVEVVAGVSFAKLRSPRWRPRPPRSGPRAGRSSVAAAA